MRAACSLRGSSVLNVTVQKDSCLYMFQNDTHRTRRSTHLLPLLIHEPLTRVPSLHHTLPIPSNLRRPSSARAQIHLLTERSARERTLDLATGTAPPRGSGSEAHQNQRRLLCDKSCTPLPHSPARTISSDAMSWCPLVVPAVTGGEDEMEERNLEIPSRDAKNPNPK